MSDLIDRQALLDAMNKHCDNVCPYNKKQRFVMCGGCPLGTAFDVIEQQPSIEAVEVVRCKDCYRAKEDKLYGGLWCGGHIRNAQWYCADGKRRADATD